MKHDDVLDCPADELPDADALVQAAMRWHFGPETGSPFWLERAPGLDFDPVRDVRTLADLRRFPNVTDDLRHVRVEDLIPRGYGDGADVVGVFESGGTTGAPKRVVLLADFLDRWVTWYLRQRDERGQPRDLNWLTVVPTGPHLYGVITREQARRRGGLTFTVDFDPRWVKRCIAEGRAVEAERYADHLIAQAAHVLETQDVGVLETTPPLLTRLARDERLVELVNDKVALINWGGASMDADTRYLLGTEVFPEVELRGGYGGTMVLVPGIERMGLGEDDPCVFDPFSPYVTFSVVDPDTGAQVGYGERGQVVMSLVSKGMLLPNNLERDLATRIAPLPGQAGDAVADVAPVATFGDETVIEGVY
jgi:phenylacetate-coenzyme A ligase PaaK-like adenylate-forming protein